MVKKGDVVYMDPPFSVRSRRVFNEYDASIFDEKAVHRLRKWMTTLSKKKVPFIVSYAVSSEADFLSKGFYTSSANVKRHIAGFASQRKYSREVLISNMKI
jgi:DNA adenine methylase